MNLSAPFITRPVMTTLLMLSALAFGIWGYFLLPVSSLPDVNFPTVTVTVPFPGTNPVTMANTVATPLEKEFMTIPGIKYVTSTNTLGMSTIVLQFDISRDIDLAAVDVNSAIVRARPNLPPNLPQEPTFKKVNPSSTPIIYVSITSPTMTPGELYDYGNTLIGQQISILEGVAEVGVYGSPSAVRVQVDPGLMAYLGLSFPDLSVNIANQNQYQPLGQFDGSHTALTIYDTGALLKANVYQPTIIAYKNGAPVRIEDLGVAVDSLQDDRSRKKYIGKNIIQPSVTLAVLGQPGANAVKVADAVNELLASIHKQLPASVEMFVVFDRSQPIRESIKDVQVTLLIAFILVILVIFIYLGKLRDTIIPTLIMPMSIITTFGIIYLGGYNLDNLSLLALTLAIGFIIDDAIVVLENIVRRIELGESPLQAALDGSKQISFTIISMTLSLIAVFIPLIFMSGLIGKLFQEFSVTLAVVTLISGVISLTLTPMLCAKFLPPLSKIHEGRFARFSVRLNQWMLDKYKNMLTWALDHRLFILLIGVINILLTVYLFKILPTDFIPDEDIGFIIGYTESAQGTSSIQMVALQNQLEEILKQVPEIKTMVSIAATPSYRQGLIFMQLVPRNQRGPLKDFMNSLYAKLGGVPGINIYLKNLPLIDLNIGPQVRGSYQYLLQSLNADDLYVVADQLYNKMRQDPFFKGTSTDLEVKTPQVTLDIDRDQASALGVNVQNFEQTLSLAFSGNRISRIQTPVNQYDVILEILRKMQYNPSSLDYIYLRSSTSNQLVPLSAVAKVVEGVGPASVNHFNQFPSATITFNIDPTVPLSTGLERLRKIADTVLTSHVTGDVKGAAETFEESFRSIGILLIVTIFVIYVVLGILYESFIHPLTILSTLPPAIVGGLLTLYITGRPLSLYAYLGIILLIGIVKKNGIIMVDFALHNIRTKGESAEKSIFDACLVRFRPIMMTTVAAIMGAVPIALGIGAGAESRRPLGFVIIGGMIVSQMITLFLTPVIYLYLENWRERSLSVRDTKD